MRRLLGAVIYANQSDTRLTSVRVAIELGQLFLCKAHALSNELYRHRGVSFALLTSVYYSDLLVEAAESTLYSSNLVRLTALRTRRTTASALAVGLEGPPARGSAPGTLVDVETPPIISARSASTVAKLIIKLSNNQKKSRTKKSRNFADHLTSQMADMSNWKRRVTRELTGLDRCAEFLRTAIHEYVISYVRFRR